MSARALTHRQGLAPQNAMDAPFGHGFGNGTLFSAGRVASGINWRPARSSPGHAAERTPAGEIGVPVEMGNRNATGARLGPVFGPVAGESRMELRPPRK